MAKVKSREEQRLDGYRQYIKDQEAIEKQKEVFDKNIIELVEKNIKKFIPEFSKENLDSCLSDLKFLLSDRREEYANALIDPLRKYKKSISRFVANIFQPHGDSFSKFLTNEIEDELDTYHTIWQSECENEQLHRQQMLTRSLSSLCLKNFKGFSDKNEEKDNTVAIKPITLIYGPNSYGKSSILQSLLLLYQTVTEEFDFRSITLKLNGNFVNLGSFNDFINQNAKEKEFRIELSLPYNRYNPNSSIITQMIIGYNFAVKKSPSTKNEQIVLSKIDVSKKEEDINLAINSEPQKILEYEFIQSEEDDNVYDIYKSGEYLNKTSEKLSFFTLEEFLNDDFKYNIFKFAEDAIQNIFYISSFRNPPARYYLPEYSVRQYVGKNGENTREILGSDTAVRKKVSYWLKTITGYTLSEENNKDKNISSINLDDSTTEIKNINLVDLGSGVAQVLPIITQSFITQDRKAQYESFARRNIFNDKVELQEGSMVLIEEPEIHLHPRAQAELGSMFADAIKATNNTFIIETHSENLLLRLEKLIRKGELSKEDVSVIYVHKDKMGSHCIPLELDDEGDVVNIKDIPGGFFEEGYNELFGND